MKIKHMFFALFVVTSVITAQSNNISVGLVSTHFHNQDGQNRISSADNPFAYGVVVGYQFDNNLSVAFTGEYSKTDLQGITGTEKDIRGHLSMYFTPIHYKLVRPYISTGLVYSNRSIDYTSPNMKDNNDGKIYGRYGIGVDIPLLNNIYFNGDLGGYSNGFKFVGWSGSFGLRYVL